MLVLASPRSPEDQLDVPDLESYYTEMNYNQAVPLSALAARARHRAKVRTSISILSCLHDYFRLFFVFFVNLSAFPL